VIAGEVMAALTTAAVSLIVSILTLWSQRRSTVQMQSIERQQLLFKMSIEELRQERDALAQACNSIQKFRDELQLLTAVNAVISMESSDRVYKARDEIISNYEHIHTRLGSEDRVDFHAVKTKVVDITTALEGSTVWAKKMIAPDGGLIQYLERMRRDLGVAPKQVDNVIHSHYERFIVGW